MRQYTFLDKLCIHSQEIANAITGHITPTSNMRENPAENIVNDSPLSPSEEKHIASLMRINYAGEICAQALYQGQALTARNSDLKFTLQESANEEIDHLYWCQSRLQDLNSHVSVLNPLWYSGSFILGAIAGLAGDKWNLGFLEETEKQVSEHLEKHLDDIPQNDHKTRAILEKMQDDEKKHAHTAHELGAATLPKIIQSSMKILSKIMTKTAYWI